MSDPAGYQFTLWGEVVPAWNDGRPIARIGIRMPYAPVNGGIINLGGPASFKVQMLKVPNVLEHPLGHFSCTLLVALMDDELVRFLEGIRPQLIDCTIY